MTASQKQDLLSLMVTATQRDKFTFLADSELRLIVELALAAWTRPARLPLPPTISHVYFHASINSFGPLPACHVCARLLPDPRNVVHAGGRFMVDVLCPCGHETILCSNGWPSKASGTSMWGFFWA